MKRLTTLLCAVLATLSFNAQTLLSEDFTTFTNDSLPPLASGWKNIDSLNNPPALDSIWRFDNPDNRGFVTPITHPAAILDSDWMGAGNSQDAYLVSPPFNASTDSVVILEFDHYYRHTGSTAEVQVFDSLTWQTVATYTASTADPEHEVIDISSIAAGESYVQIRFRYTGSFGWYWILDNIVVYQPVPNDIRLVSVDSLKNSCNLSTTETISATFENISNDTLNSVPLNYRINGGSIVAETYTGQVLPNSIITYTFNTTADFSAVGSYDIEVFSTVRNDINFFNDTAFGTTINKPSLSSFPYFEDFESGAGNWSDGGTNSSWELGTPNGVVINTAYSGSNAWVTSLRGNYNNNEESYVVSPCFDFTSLSQPQIKMRIWVESENGWDGAVLQSTIDGGQTWQKVGEFGDPNNWYNDDLIWGLGTLEPSQEGWTGTSANIGTGAWVLAENDLSGLAGEPSVELRIVFESDGSVNSYDGFAFDDVLIQDAPPFDLKALNITTPVTSNNCGFTAADSIRFQYTNMGSSYATNFDLGYIINGSTPVIETFNDTIFPGDTLIYTFNTTANFSATTGYLVELFTALGTDMDLTNDTITDSLTHKAATGFPFSDDFESGAANAAFTFITNPESNVMVRAGAANNSLFGMALEGRSAANYITPNATNVWTTNPEHFAAAKFCLDLTTAAAAELSYDLKQGYNFNNFYTNFRITVNGNQIGITHRPNGATTAWQTINENLNAYVGQVVEIAFESMVKYDSVTSSNYNYVDNIMIQLPASDDISAAEIMNPKSGCGLSSEDSVIVKIINLGALQACNFPVSFIINGDTTTETYTGCLNPGDSLFYTFLDSVDLSTPGSYNLTVYTALNGDLDTSNDTIFSTIESIPVISTFPNTEDFESGNGGWISGGSNSSWALGSPSNTIINSAASGSNAWVTNLTGVYNSNEESYVQSPCFDLSTLTDPVVKLKVWWNSENSWDGAVLQSSINGGATWQKVGDLGDPNNWYTDGTINGLTNLEASEEGWTGRNSSSNGSGTWVLAENDLTGLAGQPGVLFRIAFGSDGSVQDEGFAFDDFTVMERPQSDVGTFELIRPTTNCGLSSADSIEVSIFNNGANTETNVPIIIIVNDSITITDTLASINSGDTTSIVLDSIIDLSNPGDYTFKIYTGLGTDGNSVNDTIYRIVTNIPILSTFPYYEDFESGNGGWTVGGTNASWALGLPTNTVINSAASGSNSWVTSLTGSYNSSEESYVVAPCFDFSSLNNPIIKMNVWWNSENSWDGAVLQSSIDGGATWQKVGDFGDPNNWYTDNAINGLSNLEPSEEGWTGRNSSSNGSGSWVLAENELTGLDGESAVLLRIAFGSDGLVQDEGFAFDDVTIMEKPSVDLGAVSLIRPTSACGLTAADTLEVSILNNGLNTENNVPIIVIINDTLTITDTLASINVGDTIALTFDSLINMSNTGNYTFKIYTSVGNDGNPMNDTIIANITHVPTISTFPYNEDFESGNGAWTSGGSNSSWEHGTPNNTVINSAASGLNAWVTNLDGNYNGNEESYVLSPCFDFSSLSQPLIKMNVWWESENSWDGAVLQASTDGGATWQKVGDFGDPNNWYTDNTIFGLGTLEPSQEGWTGRTGTSNGSAGWLLAENELTGLGGQSSVRLRVVFGSDGFGSYEGFAFDDVTIIETPAIDIAVTELIAPTTQCGFSITGDSVSVKVKNFGINAVDTIPLGYIIDGGTPVIDTSFTTLAPGDSLIFTFASTATLGLPGNYLFDLYADVQNDGNLLNDTLNAEVLNSQMVVPTLVNFDNLPSGQFGNFINDWIGTSTSTFRWQSNRGTTTTTNSGPDSDHTTGSDIYMYTEASSGSQGDTAWLTSPCVDLSNSIDPALIFWYHMYGSNIEGLTVQIDSMGTWVTIDTIVGQQQSATTDAYLSDTISLVSFNNLSNTNIRFQVVRGTSFNGDVAIDDVELASIPVGLKQQKVDFSNEVVVYPNPTNNHINVEFNQAPKNNVELELVNMVGKTVYQSETRKNIERIDMSGFAKGVYLLRMTNKEQTSVKRIVLQ